MMGCCEEWRVRKWVGHFVYSIEDEAIVKNAAKMYAGGEAGRPGLPARSAASLRYPSSKQAQFEDETLFFPILSSNTPHFEDGSG